MTGTALDIKEMRHELMATYINVSLALQVTSMREQRGWTQERLAKEIGTHQNVVSAIESVRWKHWPNLSTLHRIATAFDCGFQCRFAPWSELIGDFIHSNVSTPVQSFDEEYEKLACEMNAQPEPCEK